MPLGLRTRVGPARNHVLDWKPDPHGKGHFWAGGKGRPIVKYRDTLQSPVQKRLNWSWCRLNYGLGLAQGIMDWMGSSSPPWEGTVLGKAVPIVKHRDILPRAVQKQLNQSICRLGCGLGWAGGNTSSIVFELSIYSGNAVLCQITLTTCYYYVICVNSFSLMENGGRGSTMNGSTLCLPRDNPSPLPTIWQRLHHGPYLAQQSVASIHVKNGFTERSSDQLIDLMKYAVADAWWYCSCGIFLWPVSPI